MTDADKTTLRDWMAVLCVDHDVLGWAATFASFAAACDSVVITIAAPYVAEARAAAAQHRNVTVVSLTLSDTLERYVDEVRAFVVVREPAVVSADAFDNARAIVNDDVRVGTVSFFSNDGDYLSLPRRNQPQLLLPSGMTEISMTRALRSEPMLQRAVPIPVPAGVVVVLTANAVKCLGPLLSTAATSEIAVIDLAMRGMARGLRNVVDPSTYVLRVPAQYRQVEVLHDSTFRSQLHAKYQYFPALYDLTTTSEDEPLATAIALARATIEGISVLIDGSAIGPFQMGTQVQILNLIEALSEHPGVRSVTVGIAGAIPAYAEASLKAPKVKTVAVRNGYFETTEPVDVFHRPCQPDQDQPWDHLRSIASRTVVTVQDLIAYHNGSYFPNDAAWLEYRATMRRALKAFDGVVTISSDVADHVASEQMPVAPDNIRVIPNGADHDLMHTNMPTRPPAEMLENGMVASSFLFVLGASYAHKNRDLAIAAWKELRSRGCQQKLVLAGVVVPYGSTRNEETRARLSLDASLTPDLLILPDVRAEERHWLLTHASLVLYPTSAEGFGLVPFEAAQCGTPTLFVPFGPLSEFLPGVPVGARDWTANALADAAELLLNDPALAREQVEVVNSAAKQFTWASTADQVVNFFRELLGRPAMGR